MRSSLLLAPTRRSLRWRGISVGLSWLVGCVDLPEIASSVCGNGVVEPGEDCDSFQVAGAARCRPANVSGACHIDCAAGSGGGRSACPADWGCDTNDLCREPTGSFEAATSVPLGGAYSLLQGDFDGDGRGDLLSRPQRDRLGRAPITFHYFDAQGGLSASRPFPKAVLSPVVADLTNDQRSDVLFSGFDVGLMLGSVDRSWTPETFSSYKLANNQLRTLNVYEYEIDGDSALVVLSSSATDAKLLVLDGATDQLEPRAALSGPLDTLAGQPLSANLVEDSPCSEVLIAYLGASSFDLYDLCMPGPTPGSLRWRSEALRTIITLDPPAEISDGPVLADADGDGHVDVLIGTDSGPYVALSDGTTLAAATPYDIYMDGEPIQLAMPLAAGDVTGDGQVDFVVGNALVSSWQAPGELSFHYETLVVSDRGDWTVAEIADLNGNGHPDVVAASHDVPGIDFFNGADARDLIGTRLPTNGPVLHLAVGDYDGDLINDVAYIEADTTGSDGDALMIAFGMRDAPPGKAVRVARLTGTEQLFSSPDHGLDSLVVSSTQEVDGQQIGTVTPLDGSADRIPYSAQSLVSFADDGSLEFFPAITMQPGHFLGTDTSDVLVVSTNANSASSWQLWWLADFASGVHPPLRLETELDPRLRPGSEEQGLITIRLQSAAADLDRDGRDEFLAMAPLDGDSGCGVEIFSAGGDDVASIRTRDVIVLEEPCLTPELAVVDLDADGAPELVLRTGTDDSDAQLLVLWNDGAGSFTPAQRVSAEADAPRAFTSLPATVQRPFGTLAYVTESALMLVSPGAPPELTRPRKVADLEQGSGVVAVDLDGDGVLDLVAVDGGDLKVFRAGLRAL